VSLGVAWPPVHRAISAKYEIIAIGVLDIERLVRAMVGDLAQPAQGVGEASTGGYRRLFLLHLWQ